MTVSRLVHGRQSIAQLLAIHQRIQAAKKKKKKKNDKKKKKKTIFCAETNGRNKGERFRENTIEKMMKRTIENERKKRSSICGRQRATPPNRKPKSIQIKQNKIKLTTSSVGEMIDLTSSKFHCT
jgi:hypothetical protein